MSTTVNHSPARRRLLPLVTTAAVVLAVAIAGCGGSGMSAASRPAKSGTAASGIPQGNAGDHDADNNGGPSDGDGNI
jgi:hypothetical protein